ncbi:MAG: exonuclease SbcCD subunit D [Pseudanabaenaceae cyanobacterium SKYGB_i_bin29]|nr:exonuclease SbcCD subunit D [Pseudanabaenaceae cyanobacterium SKYG29]MDW8420566.1 exonuclease SbcCD subunit D [Pseudanabaenaceae cyanobacterium SKYGB_i_bin29]
MRLVHLADLHLGFRSYSRTTSKGINQREADVFRAFKQALTKIIELAPDLVLVAGDVFHTNRPPNLTLVQTHRLWQNFAHTTGIETIIIAGNHDSVKTKDNACILELFALIPGITVVWQQPEVIINATGDIRVACLPHNALAEVDKLDLRPDRDFRFNVLLLHGTIDKHWENDYGGAAVPRELLEKDWDYVACGHFHSFHHIDRFIYYAGAIERTSNDIWQEAGEEKGFIEFDLEHKKVFFHPLETRKTIDLPIIDAQGKTIEEIDNLIADHVRQTDITDALVRQRVINLPRSNQNQLNYRQIRQFQQQALHYLFVTTPPPLSKGEESSSLPQGGLYQEARQFLTTRPLSPDIPRADFVRKGLEYLQKV